MEYAIFVDAKITVEGQHRWPDAPAHLSYLSTPHRHLFEITARVRVDNPDRQVEFIDLGHQMRAWLSSTYPRLQEMIDFGPSSCEMIARALIDQFKLTACFVYEDGESGAAVVCLDG